MDKASSVRVRDYQPDDILRCHLVFAAALGAYDPRPAKQAADIHFLRGQQRLQVAYDEDGRIVVVDGPRRDVLDHLRRQGFAFCGDRS